MLTQIFTSEAFIGLVSAIVLGGLGWLANWIKKKGVEAAAVDTIKNAVQLVHDEFVHALKAASADGKLTKEEVDTARDLAVKKALELAKGPVKDLLISWGTDKLKALIGRIAQSGK